MTNESPARLSQADLKLEITHLRQCLAEKELALAKLQDSIKIYQTVLDESSDPIFLFDRDGTYLYVNNAFAEGVGKPLESILNHRIWDVFPQEEADKRYTIVKWVYANAQARQVEVRVPRPDGDRYYITTAKPIFDAEGLVTNVLCISKEITDRKRMEEELRSLSINDLLSGVYNRNFFETEVDRIQESRLFPVSIVMVDLNNLKRVNDLKGHAAGDDLIRKAARVLKDSFRVEDIIARYGGDEFVVLLTQTGETDTAAIVQRVREAVKAANDPDFSLAFGWATGQKGDSLDEVMRLADDRMYQDKKRTSRRIKKVNSS